MKNKLQKILVAMSILGLTSIAQAETTNFPVVFSGSIAPGCIVNNTPTGTITGNVGTIGTSGAIGIAVVCNGSVSYQLQPVNDVVTVTGGPEEISITAWKDSDFAQQLTTASSISSSSSTTHTIYLRANGPVGNADNGNGYILTKAQTFTTTYPVKIVY